MKTRIFSKHIHIKAPVEEVFQWHSRPGALERLSPPWDPVKVIQRSGGINPGASVKLKMKAGIIPYTWTAKHTAYEENQLFQDEQIKGPFSKWIHTHRFKADGPDNSILEDRIEYALPLNPLSNILMGSFIHKELQRIFHYRHNTLIEDLKAHLARNTRKPLNILISGASGVIGSALIPFLTTGGHRVFRLVRKKPNLQNDEIFWDPNSEQLNLDHVPKIDAVIHLAGEHIGKGKWTEEKKNKIIHSRNKGTTLIAKAVSQLKSPPAVLLCASAIGFYGDRHDHILTEQSNVGDDFISKVCSEWEKATFAAQEKGIRTAYLRIGIGLSPLGGALSRLLTPFKMGFGGKIGSGKQYLSWIGIDDIIGSIYHVLLTKSLAGPVNIVAPNPVSNFEFTKILGKILNRPTICSIPEHIIKLAFGEMGREILLASCRVIPEKLQKSGYQFRHSNLEKVLCHLLGK